MSNNAKKLGFVFIVSFFLNLIWENIHSLMYVYFKGEEITEAVLVRASFFDALFITLSAFFIIFLPWRNISIWLSVFLLLILSIFIEKWALVTGRWIYNEMMPIIPVLKTGLTPTLQLALLGYLSFRLSDIDKQDNVKMVVDEEAKHDDPLS
ncbi:MAG: hypothetical protein AAB840_02515 [Patescibacteria group bacterium]